MRRCRVELCLLDELAAEMFALVVFVSDGLLKTKTSSATTAARFFNIARLLPLELQMVLCFRQVGSDKEIISGKDSEAAFKFLATRIEESGPPLIIPRLSLFHLLVVSVP